MTYRYFCTFCTEDNEGKYIYGNSVIDLDHEIHCAMDINELEVKIEKMLNRRPITLLNYTLMLISGVV